MPNKITQNDLDERNKQQMIDKIPSIRYEKEKEGIMYNGVLYSGSQSNRQALREAIEQAEDEGIAEFEIWKDSNNQFHQNHSVQDVKEATRKIGKRRSALIGLESQFIKKISNGEISDLNNLDWTTQYD